MGQDARSSTRTAWTSLITLSNGFSTAGVKYDDPTVPWDTASLVTGMHQKIISLKYLSDYSTEKHRMIEDLREHKRLVLEISNLFEEDN